MLQSPIACLLLRIFGLLFCTLKQSKWALCGYQAPFPSVGSTASLSLHTTSRSPKVCHCVPCRHRGTDPPLCRHRNHTREKPARGTAPHWRRRLGLFQQRWFAARDFVSCQRCCAEFSPARSVSNLDQNNPSPPPDEEKPPLRRKVRVTTVVAEVATDSREVIEANRSIGHSSASVRRVSAGGARGATGEGAGGASSGETAMRRKWSCRFKRFAGVLVRRRRLPQLQRQR